MTYLLRRPFPVRALCLLLIAFILGCALLVPHAHAVFLEGAVAYYGVEIIVTVLAAAGVVFASSEDGQRVGAAVYQALADAGSSAIDKLGSLANWALDNAAKIPGAAYRVGQDLYDAITGAFTGLYDSGGFVGDSISVTLDRDFFSTFDRKAFALKKYTYAKVVSGSDSYIFSVALSDRTFRATYQVNGGDAQIYDKKLNLQESSIYSPRWVSLYPNKYDSGQVWVYAELNYLHSDGVNWGAADRKTYEVGTIYSAPTATFGYSIDIPAPDLAYPSDDYLVKAPDLPKTDEETGVVSWPDDMAYTKDAVTAPYPVGDDGVKVPDIPFDVPVDGTTGKALDDTGTTDPDAPDTPGEGTGIAGLLGKIIALLTSFFDSPSDFQLNMDGFRNLAIKDKFPFCIPFDMVDSVREFAASAADYQLHIKIDGQYLQIDHTVDLTPFAVPIAFFRYLCVTWFVWVLISRTHDLIKW